MIEIGMQREFKKHFPQWEFAISRVTIDFILKGEASEENLQNFILKVLNGQMLDI